MKKLMLIFSCLLAVILSMPALAGTVEVSGVVYDAASDEVLPGANVFVKGTMIGAASNLEGKFSFTFETNNDFELVVGYMGYKTQELVFSYGDDVSNLSIRLAEDVFRGEAVVVTGIASKTSKDVAEVAVSRVPAAELAVSNSYSDVSQMVAGKVAGVKMEYATGQVGGGIRFNMRSGGGLNGNEQPIIYIDGVRIENTEFIGYGTGGQGNSTLSDLNPDDIESIEFLKGPAGAASYGTDGSNGVVLITTKRGALVPGKPKGISIDYKMVTGFNQQSYEYDEETLSYKDANRIFKDGPVQEHSLSVYGGSGLMKYFVGLTKHNETGIIQQNQMDRMSFRTNVDVFPSDKVLLKASASYTDNVINRPPNDNNGWGWLGNVLLLPYSYLFLDSASVAGQLNETKSNRFIGSIQASYTPMKNLQVSLSLGVDDANLRQDQTIPAGLYYSNYGYGGQRGIYDRRNTQYTYDLNARYSYNITEDLSATSTLGSQMFDRKRVFNWSDKYDYETPFIMDIGAGAEFESISEGKLHLRQAGIFATQNFSYKDQYYMTLMVRKDYASVVGKEAPSIIYPGASLAVRVDKWGFLPSSVDMLKLRAAYGETGQLPGLEDGIPLLWEAEPSAYGGGGVTGAIGNNEIEPERVKEYEVGFEAELFNKYSVEFTYYNQSAEGSIVDFLQAPSTGLTATAMPLNVGKIDGWGIESMIQARPVSGRNFSMDLGLVNNYQDNEVKDLGGAQPISGPYDLNYIVVGQPKHVFYTQKVHGALFNEDGTYAGVDADVERSALGTPIPNYTGSFYMNFTIMKNLKIYAMADWATGHQIFNNSRLFMNYLGPVYGMGANTKEYNEVEQQLANATPGTDEYIEAAHKYAKLNINYDANYIEDADYLKLREVSVSYSFKDLLPKAFGAIGQKQMINDLVLGFSGRNLWTTTKYSGPDVEANSEGSRSLARGQDFLTLQHPRVVTAWLRVSL